MVIEKNNSTVKVVDFGPFLDGSDRQGVSDAILDSFKTIGFVYLVNHGLPQDMIDSMFFWVSPNGFSYPIRFCDPPFFNFGIPSRRSYLNSQWRSNSLLPILYRAPTIEVFIMFFYFSVLLGRFCHLGYSAPGREKVFHLKFDGDDSDITKNSGTTNSEVQVQKDIKESFEVGREDDPVMPNIWYPDGVLPGFQDACKEFYWVSTSSYPDISI
jgi:hypothetical protein